MISQGFTFLLAVACVLFTTLNVTVGNMSDDLYADSILIFESNPRKFQFFMENAYARGVVVFYAPVSTFAYSFHL